MTRDGFRVVALIGRLFVFVTISWLIGTTTAHAVTQGDWVATGRPIDTLATGGSLIVLADGTPLLFGLDVGGVQQYHPDTGAWTARAPLQASRGTGATVTLLLSDVVLLAGGPGAAGNTAELYDAHSNTSTPAASLVVARRDHQATLLGSGRVLVSGGMAASGQPLSSTEIYDPLAGTWTPSGALNQARSGHAAVRLSNGRVLAAGGSGASGPLASAEIYDPISGTWSVVSAMDRARSDLKGVALADGRILVAGIQDPTSQVYDPASNTWAPGVTIGFVSLMAPRGVSELVILHDGTPLAAVFTPHPGFCVVCNVPRPAAALFGVNTGQWTPINSPDFGVGPLAALPDGRALAPGPAQVFQPSDFFPHLVVSPTAVDFGTTGPGLPVQRTLTLQNTGGPTLTGSATTSAPFVVVSGSPFSIASGGSASLTVQFTAPGFGTFTGALQFTSNGNALSVPMTAGVGIKLSGRITNITGFGVANVPINLTGASSGDTVTDATGQYRFFVPANNGYNVTPASPGLTFTPSTRNVVVATQDVGGQDFVATFAPSQLGVVRGAFWSLDLNGNTQWDGCGVDGCRSFGLSSDKPVVGDWNGTGRTRIGVFRNGIWSLDFNGNGQWDGCNVDRCPAFGLAGDEPVAGDWTGSGHENIGVFRDGQWSLDLNGNGQWDGCTVDACVSFGLAGDLPVVGDWTGAGHAKIGVFRNGLWFLDLNGNGIWDGCAVDACFGFGLAGDLPVVGDWTGTGQVKIGVFRDGVWYLDLNGNGQWDGCGVDACVGFGLTGDHPVVGNW